MWTVAASLAAGVVAGLLSRLFLSSPWAAVPPAVTVAIVTAFFLLRWASQKLEPVMETVQKHLAGGRKELALSSLREALSFGRWNPLLPGQVRIQIGAIEYVSGNLEEADAQLSRASRYPWISRAYLGCVKFKRKDAEGMKKAFDTAIKVGDKEGIVYTLYAWCLQAVGDKDAAVKVLETGLQKIPGDHRLEVNLELAKEGKKLKTAPYGEAWTRFGLDAGEGPVLPKQMRGFAARPGFRQKPQRKKR
jgi:hypothetical protein